MAQFRRRGKGCLSYVVEFDGEALIVDPSADIERYAGYCAEHELAVVGVLDTHLHADHLSGARALARSLDIPHYLSGEEGYAYQSPYGLEGGLQLRLGTGSTRVAVSVLGAAGHTRGSTMVLLDGEALLSGDALFVDGVGRPDLADHAADDAALLHATLQRVLNSVPEKCCVLPAHCAAGKLQQGPGLVGAPLGEVTATVEALSLGREDFIELALASVNDRPGNYQRIVELNRQGLLEFEPELRALEAGPNRCAL